MKSFIEYLSVFFFLITLFLTISCEGIVDDFSNMSKFRDSLQKVYPEEEIRVKISNGTYLGVSFINSDLKKLKKEEKDSIAKKVGRISRKFFHNDQILNGDLTFVIYNNYIVFKYSESIDNYDLYLTDTINENFSF